MTHTIPGRGPVSEAIKARRGLREIVIDNRASADLMALADTAREAGIPVRRADRPTLDRLSQGVLHQGVVAVEEKFRYARLPDVADRRLVVVLDGVTDPQNLGAIARSAEAAGAAAIVIRERRGASVTPAAEKAAAGALSWLPVVVVTNIVRVLQDLATRGYWSVGLTGEAATPLWEAPLLDGPVAVVVGAEGTGLSRLVEQRVDQLVRIPMVGRMSSLNASAASAVALFEVVRRGGSSAPDDGVRPAH